MKKNSFWTWFVKDLKRLGLGIKSGWFWRPFWTPLDYGAGGRQEGDGQANGAVGADGSEIRENGGRSGFRVVIQKMDAHRLLVTRDLRMTDT